MANSLSNEAFLPCLLDRLTDDDPSSQKEAHFRQTLSLASYRKSVLRDLGALLNSPSHSSSESFEEYPEVTSSVVNYGMTDMCGKTASSINHRELEGQLAASIVAFEPRIIPGTLSVRVVPGVNKTSPNLLGIEIRGLMWANPMPEQFLLESKLDLETGKCEF